MYDPSITQKVKIASDGRTDRHKVQELTWRAIDNLEEGLKESKTDITGIQLQLAKLPDEVKIKTLIHHDRAAFRRDVANLKRLTWGVLVVIAMDILVHILGR